MINSLQLINDKPSHEIKKLLAKTKKESDTKIAADLRNRKSSEKPATADIEAAKAGSPEVQDNKVGTVLLFQGLILQ